MPDWTGLRKEDENVEITPRQITLTTIAFGKAKKLERCIDAGVDDYASAVKAITPLPALRSHSKKMYSE